MPFMLSRCQSGKVIGTGPQSQSAGVQGYCTLLFITNHFSVVG